MADLFETMFFASLQTEEGRATRFDIVYLDPEDPDPDPPKHLRRDRWRFVPFTEPREFTVAVVTKLAQASDPRTSAFVVYPKGKVLQVWGLVDQGNRYHDYVNRDIQSRPSRPGLFQAGISGPARVTAHANGKRIAELRSGLLSQKLVDALGGGPVRKALETGIRRHMPSVSDDSERAYQSIVSTTRATVRTTAIKRILIRAQNFRHGGTLLITPDGSFSDLAIKYAIEYQRLPEALVRLDQSRNRLEAMSDELVDPGAEENLIPRQRFWDYDAEARDVEQSRTELDGSVWFISLLTRVDGLVLMDPTLCVRGFGVVITVDESERPMSVFRTTTQAATPASQTEIDYEHYGTRHQSVMRYCNRHPGSVGLVISQDGDVRAITKVGERLVMWDNINLQNLRQIRLEQDERRERHTTPEAV